MSLATIMRRLSCSALLILVAACKPINLGADGSVDGTSPEDAGTQPTSDPDGPLVRVLSPAAVSALPSRNVLVSTDVEVRCQVKDRSADAPVDPSSVQIYAYVGHSDTAAQSVQAAAVNPDVYAATVSLAGVPAGPLRFECGAQDTQSPAHSGLGSVSTFLDLGPKVIVKSPSDGSAVARNDKVLVRFDVVPAPLQAGDAQAAVDSVRLDINGQSVTPTRDAGGTYNHEIDLTDLSAFPQTTSALRITVRSKNRRAPIPAESKTVLTVAIDSTGPKIDVSSPDESSFVGQEASLVATVTDDGAGVKTGSVRATITVNNKTDTYPLIRGSADDGQGDVYSASIDAGRYTGRAQITINVIAEDRAGNETRVSRLVFVDSVPPWVSLDAPNIRVRTPDPTVASGAMCSASFDPVGEDAVNDLDVLKTEFGMYRAVVWERGISLKGETIVNVSTLEDGSVALFVQGNNAVPLIVDSDGDHTCDKIATNPDPTHPELAPVRVPLSPVLAQGALPPASDPGYAPSMTGYCDPIPYTQAIGPMCPGAELPFAIHHTAAKVGPAIYAVSPADGMGAGCAGLAWQATVSSGWACVVGTAKDALGNVGISKPLRVCYDLDGKGCTTAAPSCTDGCKMPDEYVAQGMPRLVDQDG